MFGEALPSARAGSALLIILKQPSAHKGTHNTRQGQKQQADVPGFRDNKVL